MDELTKNELLNYYKSEDLISSIEENLNFFDSIENKTLNDEENYKFLCALYSIIFNTKEFKRVKRRDMYNRKLYSYILCLLNKNDDEFISVINEHLEKVDKYTNYSNEAERMLKSYDKKEAKDLKEAFYLSFLLISIYLTEFARDDYKLLNKEKYTEEKEELTHAKDVADGLYLSLKNKNRKYFGY